MGNGLSHIAKGRFFVRLLFHMLFLPALSYGMRVVSVLVFNVAEGALVTLLPGMRRKASSF
ncbi:hypothetical protein CFR74_02985 [Novacetimonas hansenii]|nr:hypothetical protein CFR74_02985 [Novacetimonas hansenii]